MLTAFAGWNEALLGMLGNVEHVFKWGIYDRDPLHALDTRAGHACWETPHTR